MKKMKLFWTLLCCMMTCNLFAQQQITLIFEGENQSGNYVQLSKVVLTNITRGWSDTLYYPDTTAVLTVENTSISENNATFLGCSQNTPNPFYGTTQVTIAVAESSPLSLEIMDLNGRLIAEQNYASIDRGTHQFSIQLSTPQMYLLTAFQNGKAFSIKMLNKGNAGIDKIEYKGVVLDKKVKLQTKSNTKGIINHPFDYDDLMTFKGYAFIDNEAFESAIDTETQHHSGIIMLTFEVEMTDGQPCPGMATLTDIDGNTYNTVQIGNQCWMKENLQTTKYADGTTIPQLSAYLYGAAFWCYPDNNASNKNRYGLLYSCDAATKNSPYSETNPSGVQGICPTGWHLPSKAEWTQLTNYVSSQSQYICDNNNTYIAKALAATTAWGSAEDECAIGNDLSMNNVTGFTALPTGHYAGSFYSFGRNTRFWSATLCYSLWLICEAAYVADFYDNGSYGLSVRCIRD